MFSMVKESVNEGVSWIRDGTASPFYIDPTRTRRGRPTQPRVALLEKIHLLFNDSEVV